MSSSERYNERRKRSKDDRYKRKTSSKTDKYEGSVHTQLSNRSHISSTSATGTVEDVSFISHLNELIKMFGKYMDVIEDIDDFKIFAKKYDTVEKKKIKTASVEKDAEKVIKENYLGLSNKYDPSYFVNIDLKIPSKEMDVFYMNRSSVFKTFISKFRCLICLYLNFKQKEKFTTLQKIRTTQNNLPVLQYKNEILEAVSNEKVVIIAGDTGCGKSTQIPQYLLQAGYNRIACTQPRRIACISLSKRVARETLSEFNSQVGFQIRFEKKRNSDTKILFITEGLLLRQVSDENQLSEYDVIVLDEVHERHLHGDFLLGIAKCLIYQRTDMKLILMSATINIELFTNYFGSLAKVIQIPGRLYPIKLQYHPITNVDRTANDRFDPSSYIRILQLIDKKYPRDERGDVLIFLSGVKEITSLVDAATLYNENVQSWCILPLYSSLCLADQDKVFDYPPEGFRKCVVSTNIAETSITIDGIRFVVDSGKVNEISYDPVCKMQRLKEFWISRASAEQRKGRAGRTGPGVCFRLYSEEEYGAMSQYTTPEIQRVPLDSVLLQMIAMGLPDARKFPFIEPPAESSIENAILALKQYTALSLDEKLTEIGKMLSRLPVDIPLGKMLIMGSVFHQVGPVLSLASSLSVQSPFTNRAYRDRKMQDARKDMESNHGDPITLLNIYREWLQMKDDAGKERGSSYVSKKWCRRLGLEEQRFYEMTKLRSQFKDLLIDCGLINADLSSVKSAEEMTSSERILRHGEMKQLKRMKQSLDKEAPRKPKILKIDSQWTIDSEEMSEQDASTDVRDVEFRLKNNPSQVQNLLKDTIATTYKDLSILKVIFCSALYPQIAIPDEFNSSRTVKEQLFHTVGKPFVALHPNSYFVSNSDALQLNECDIINPPDNFSSKLPISSKHQVIFYMSLLETVKPYLVNNVRMPAAQTLLLFCREIQTNSNFSRVICDSWLEVKFILPSAAEILLLKVTKIRSMWNNLLTSSLQGKPYGDTNEDLTVEILEFMSMEIFYTLKRLLPADLKTIYTGPLNNSPSCDNYDLNPFDMDFHIHANKKYGGIQLTEYLTYNCLEDEIIYEPWKCDHCDLVSSFLSFERLCHKQSHLVRTAEVDNRNSKTSHSSRDPNLRSFYCETCRKEYQFRATDILKHRKQHEVTDS